MTEIHMISKAIIGTSWVISVTQMHAGKILINGLKTLIKTISGNC